MKKTKFHRKMNAVKCVLLWILMFTFQAQAQLITNVDNASNLVKNVLLGPGVKVTNIKYNGAATALGFFNGAKSNIGLVVVNDQKSWNELIEKLKQQESNGG